MVDAAWLRVCARILDVFLRRKRGPLGALSLPAAIVESGYYLETFATGPWWSFFSNDLAGGCARLPAGGGGGTGNPFCAALEGQAGGR